MEGPASQVHHIFDGSLIPAQRLATFLNRLGQTRLIHTRIRVI